MSNIIDIYKFSGIDFFTSTPIHPRTNPDGKLPAVFIREFIQTENFQPNSQTHTL